MVDQVHKALSHKLMASETVPVTVLLKVSVWWTTTFLRFMSSVKIKNPLIPPKNLKKDITWQNNVCYQFFIKIWKERFKKSQNVIVPKVDWTIDLRS